MDGRRRPGGRSASREVGTTLGLLARPGPIPRPKNGNNVRRMPWSSLFSTVPVPRNDLGDSVSPRTVPPLGERSWERKPGNCEGSPFVVSPPCSAILSGFRSSCVLRCIPGVGRTPMPLLVSSRRPHQPFCTSYRGSADLLPGILGLVMHECSIGMLTKHN